MVKRVITALVCLPILIIVVYLGGLPLRAALLALSLIGLYEFYRAFSKKQQAIHICGYVFSVIYYLTIGFYAEMVFAGFILCCLAVTVLYFKHIKLTDCLVTISGFFYVTFLLSFVYLVRFNSVYFVWLIFISASASDTFAYFIGRKFGRHKLHGTPSPGKTIEGCLGGVFGAALVGLLYSYVLQTVVGLVHPIILNAVLISMFGAIFSQFGDLFASAIKRSVGIKDFGKLLPGHGGVLDRFDSIIVTAPVVYMVIWWL